jgi:outer membrane lipoprotein carrier protein
LSEVKSGSRVWTVRWRAFCFVVGLLPGAAAHAGTAQQTLNRFTQDIKTFQAHFDQVQTDENGAVTGKSSGDFWLSRPTVTGDVGKFRWAYQQPYQQVTVCDGSKLWSYDPDLDQVTVRAAKQALSGTPAELLAQKNALGDRFTVQDAGRAGNANLIRLEPKTAGGDFKSIELAIGDDGALRELKFSDPLGGQSKIDFSAVKINQAIDARQFRFTPPENAQVINADGGAKPSS